MSHLCDPDNNAHCRNKMQFISGWEIVMIDGACIATPHRIAFPRQLYSLK
jgi:hypothetical protein